jgi:hypothetical protein
MAVSKFQLDQTVYFFEVKKDELQIISGKIYNILAEAGGDYFYTIVTSEGKKLDKLEDAQLSDNLSEMQLKIDTHIKGEAPIPAAPSLQVGQAVFTVITENVQMEQEGASILSGQVVAITQTNNVYNYKIKFDGAGICDKWFIESDFGADRKLMLSYNQAINKYLSLI